MKKLLTFNSLFLLIVIAFAACIKSRNSIADNQLKIDVHKAKQLDLKSVCNQIEIIPLETTSKCIVGHCNKVDVYRDNFYILDNLQNAIFVFNKNGKFLYNTLNLKGKGPDQYSFISDFNVNKKKKIIEILDPPNKAIKQYSLDGHYVGTCRLNIDDFPLYYFICLTDDIYVFYSKTGKVHTERLAFYSFSKGGILKLAAPLPEKVDKISSSKDYPFYYLNDSLFFHFDFPANDLFYVDAIKLNLIKKYSFDFGNANFLLDYVEKNQTKSYYRSFSKINDYAFISNIKENSTNLIVSYYYNKKLHFVIMNKRQKQFTNAFNQAYSSGQLPEPDFIDDDYLYYLCEPIYIKSIFSYELTDSLSRVHIQKVNQESNPFIVKYRLK